MRNLVCLNAGHRLRLAKTFGAAFICLSAMGGSAAETVIYTFDSPQFSSGQTTPLLNRPPNIGSSDFRTDFTASPTPNGFLIATFQPNPLFSGQMLYDPTFPVDLLMLTFNQPVEGLQFDFAVNMPGYLTVTSSAGSQRQDSAPVGGGFEGGTFSYHPSANFTSVQLAGFNRANAPTRIAVDDLMVTVVPEPGTLGLALLGGLGLLVGWRCGFFRERV